VTWHHHSLRIEGTVFDTRKAVELASYATHGDAAYSASVLYRAYDGRYVLRTEERWIEDPNPDEYFTVITKHDAEARFETWQQSVGFDQAFRWTMPRLRFTRWWARSRPRIEPSTIAKWLTKWVGGSTAVAVVVWQFISRVFT